MKNRSQACAGRVMMAAALSLLFAQAGRADDFEGVDGLLKKLNGAQSPASNAAPAAASNQESVVQFAKDLASFSAKSPGMAPEEAAQAWLALFNRSLKLQADAGAMRAYSSAARATFSALPGPAAWPALQKLVESGAPGKEISAGAWPALRLIVHTLNNVEDQQWADLDGLVSVQPSSPVRFSFNGQTGDGFLALGTALSETSNHPDQVEKFWETALSRPPAALDPAADSSNTDNQFELPDLVTILGPARAEPLVLQALLRSSGGIAKIDGAATQELARKLALAHLDGLHIAPWFLTQSLEGVPLYEALRKKFPNDANGPSSIYYVIALVVQGRAEEAAKADVNIDASQLEEATEQAAKAGWGPQVYDFLHTYLAAHPESDLWEFYINLAAQTGHAKEALQFVQDTDARADLSGAAHEQIRTVLYRGLLAVDRVPEGIDQLRALIKSEKAKSSPASTTSATSPSPASAPSITAILSQLKRQLAFAGKTGQNADPTAKIIKWDIALARLGHLLKQDALENEGLDDALREIKSRPSPQPGWTNYSPYTNGDNEVMSYLMETGRYAQAEGLLIDQIVQGVRKLNDQSKAMATSYRIAGLTGTVIRRGGGYPGEFDYETREAMKKLALVYYEAGRWPDIIALLEKVPGWGASDLVDIATEGSYLTRRTVPHLDLIAARALVETGRVDEALPILDYALQEDPGNDAAYALLLKVGKGDLTAKLDALYAQDQFQERPLIWKAVVLLQQGKVADAENACKATIAVDPSDGEEGKGDRMRVYSVMADVCDAKKDATQATFFRNVVKAIRLSEDADDYYDAGLLTHAVSMYSDALNLFSDAYCIQSRIARQLAELGRLDEASVHYRKAFELMPVSFGRLESHCFGCERAFKGKTAVGIAEKTFTEMMAKDPQKPQIPYLLGYLYMEEKRFPEALANFQKAAQLDPDYINAWRHIVEIGDEYQLDPSLRDAAVFNLLRLDPAGRHTTPNTHAVRQLDKLWAAEEKANAAVLPVPKALFNLGASAALHQANGDAAGTNPQQTSNATGIDPEAQAWMDLQQISLRLGRGFYHPRGEGVSPVDAVLESKVISGALGFL